MALAPLAYTLWQRYLRFDPADPIWPNRDRFVLSAGHASMLLYSLLFLADVRAVEPDYEVVGEPAVCLDDIERFRQLDSKAPGHPEYRWTSGVETTTGPLGQGVATSVGMAIASKWQGARYGAELFDFDVYAIGGDGCLMEGVSNEAASLAGHLKLDNLCWVYDNNHITIDGKTELAYGDDVAAALRGLRLEHRPGRRRQRPRADRRAPSRSSRREEGRPTLIVVDSHIGWGSPHKQDTSAAHGEPLGEEEVRETKRAYDWPEDAQFLVPDGVREHFAEGIGKRGAELQRRLGGEARRVRRGATPTSPPRSRRRRGASCPRAGTPAIPSFDADEKGIATRKASNKVENAIGERLPWLLAGSADLTDSTSVRFGFDGAADFEPGAYDGRQLHYGIREHESAAISNGLSLSKLRPLWSTYLTFSDYARPAIRLSALMELPVIHLFTHDSIGLGEDGPTHQPVEQLASLRAIPGLDVIRPADANEVAEAWRVALDRTHQPVALVLTRQNVPVFDRSKYASAEGLRRGGYVLADAEGGEPEVILIATGSEVALARRRPRGAERRRDRARASSACPAGSSSTARTTPTATRCCRRRSPPASRSRRPRPWAGTATSAPAAGKIGMHTFGSSAPLEGRPDKFGFTPDKVAEAAREAARHEAHRSNCTTWARASGSTTSPARCFGDGTLAGYIDELSVTGLTSNPTIFDKAISGGDAYDEQIPRSRRTVEIDRGDSSSSWRSPTCATPPTSSPPVHERTAGVDGFCSLEVSPLIADDTEATIEQAAKLHAKAERDNLFIKIPGTEAGRCRRSRSRSSPASRSTSPCSSTTEQYLAAADAYMKGIERRIEAGLDPDVASVASIFMSRWDVAVAGRGARRAAATGSGWRSASTPTAPTASCSTRSACSA